MQSSHRILAALVASLAAVGGVIFATQSGASLPVPVERTSRPVPAQMIPGATDWRDCLPVTIPAPAIGLDPGLRVSGDEVKVVQETLGVPADGVYGPETAGAVPATVTAGFCDYQLVVPYLHTALQALSDASPALVAVAEARQATRPTVSVPAAPQVAVAAPVSGDCFGVNQYAAYIYQHESGCRTDATNGGGCRGIGQACPGSKLPCSDTDFACQHEWFSGYAESRYGGWEAAYQAWLVQHWW